MGGVAFGSPVSSANTNSAFLEKNDDDATVGRVGLLNTLSESGASVINLQRTVNSIASALGISTGQVYNFLITWAANYVGAPNDTIQSRINALVAEFSGSTGHAHSGVDGDGAPVAALNIASVDLKSFVVQGMQVVGATGGSTVVTSLMVGKTSSANSTTKGVVTNAPYNKLPIRNTDGTTIVDGSGNEVYARLTYVSTVWTLTYYSLVSGTETAYSFGGSQTFNWWYLQLINPIADTGFEYASDFFIPSDNATADVIDATATLRGLINATAQTIGGKKTFNGGIVSKTSLELPQFVDSTTTGTAVSLTYSAPVIEVTNASLISINNISSPTDGKFLILINKTGTNVLLINQSGGTSANQIRTGSGSNLAMKDGSSVLLVYDANTSLWQIVGGSGSGSGSGVKNYISGLDGESGTAGFATYANGAAIPTNGIGGSPTATLTTTGSSPLSGSNSLLYTPGALGNGFSYDFTLDLGDTVSQLWLNLSLAFTGAFVSGDITMWLYDITNSQLIPAVTTGALQNSPIVNKQTWAFPTTQSTSYRLIVHQATSNASYTFKFEGTLGPQTFSGFSPITTDPLLYTPATAGTGTNSYSNVTWSRRGKYMLIKGSIQTGTVSATPFTVPLPTGYSIDYTSTGLGTGKTSGVGEINLSNNTGTLYSTGGFTSLLFVDGTDASNVYMATTGNANPGTAFAKANASSTYPSNSLLDFTFELPIAGWSSDSAVVSVYDGRTVVAQFGAGAANMSSLSANTDIVWPLVTYDSHGVYNGSNGRYVAPVTGTYTVEIGEINSNGGNDYYAILVNGVRKGLVVWNPGSGGTISFGSIDLKLNAGDYFTIQPQVSLSILYSAGNYQAKVSVSLKSGAQQILAGHRLAAEYHVSANYSYTAGNPINFDVKELDTAISVTTGASWKFTAPVSGDYLVVVQVYVGVGMNLYISKNGTAVRYIGYTQATAGPNVGSTIISLIAGDYIQVMGDGSPTIIGSSSTGGNLTSIQIKQI